jgi:hypothetical protein
MTTTQRSRLWVTVVMVVLVLATVYVMYECVRSDLQIPSQAFSALAGKAALISFSLCLIVVFIVKSKISDLQSDASTSIELKAARFAQRFAHSSAGLCLLVFSLTHFSISSAHPADARTVTARLRSGMVK